MPCCATSRGCRWAEGATGSTVWQGHRRTVGTTKSLAGPVWWCSATTHGRQRAQASPTIGRGGGGAVRGEGR